MNLKRNLTVLLIVTLAIMVWQSIGAITTKNAKAYDEMAALYQAEVAENARLSKELAIYNNEQVLYENSKRDNQTVNTIARWHVFGEQIIILLTILTALSLLMNAYLVLKLKAAQAVPPPPMPREWRVAGEDEPFDWQ